MKEHVELWLGSLQRRTPKPASSRTVEAYSHKVNNFLEWLGDRPPTPEILFAYRMERQRAGRAPATIRVDFAGIYDFFSYLRRQKLVAMELPRAGDVALPSRPSGSSRPRLSDRDVAALFVAAERMPAHTDRKRYLRGRALCILALLAGAGLRRAELLGLRVSHVRQELEPWHVQVVDGKGAQPGLVPIGDDTRAHIEEWLATRRRWCIQHKHTSDALLPVDSVRSLSDRGLDSIWRELVELAGIGDRGFTPHCLRHWFGTQVHASVDLATAQKMLRHKRMETTFQYLGTDQDKMQEAAQAISFRNRTTEVRQESGSQPLPDAVRRTDARFRRGPRRLERRQVGG